ncbi:hypothetical protein HDU79_007504 [Rhizoclosmatium sp. JEL0117]|nr:hypothetical protein HDU79_007504 [Rhizoclosmatium sp. JEL0117]
MNLKWTLFDYCQFLATSDNVPTLAEAERKAQQALKDGTKRKERKWTPKIVKAEERNGAFYLSMAIGLVAHYLFYGFALAYCRKYEYNTPTGFLSLFDWKGVLDHVMFFILFYCDIWISYVLATLGMVIALGAPYTPIFDQPYLATSLRDFWSHRWNYPIKLTFHRLVFTPLLSLFESYNKATSPNTSKHRHTELQLVTATFASFCFSAMFHEYILVLLMPDEKAGVQFTFFIINGVLCIAQIWLQRMTGFGISWGFGRGWKVVGWALTAATLLTTAPLFVGSYARTGTMMQLPVPDRVVSFWQMLI